MLLIRIVKMQFLPDKVAHFRAMFDDRKHLIRHFDGCLHLDLWQDTNQPNIFFTHSHWQSEQHLRTYRTSALFAEVWKQTRQWFEEPAQAWSVINCG